MPARLVTIELRFRSEEDPSALGDRIKEAARMIVGGPIEEFRVRTLPLAPLAEKKDLRPAE